MQNMQTVDMYLSANAKFFPPEKMAFIREQLMLIPEEQFSMVNTLDMKDPTTLLLVSIFVGEFGVDRFILGDIGLGVAKLLTFGGCGIWWIIDMFLIMGKTREVNFNILMNMINQSGVNNQPLASDYYGSQQ